MRNSEKFVPRLSIITTTNMCIWIFSYMLDGFSYASPPTRTLCCCRFYFSPSRRSGKRKKRKKRKKWKIFYRNVFFFRVETMVRVDFFPQLDYVFSPSDISWGRFTFNIWITQRVVVEREWNKRRYI